MSERNPSYVGVSGIVNPEQQARILEIGNENGLTASRRLLIGVKAVHKTQWLDTENKYGDQWYPVGKQIHDVLDPELNTFNVAQMYYDPDILTLNPTYALKFMQRVQKRMGSALHAVQFDMLPYPERPMTYTPLFTQLAEHGYESIVQCHVGAMKTGPRLAIETLKRVSPHLGYVLFDSSHGRGLEMNPDALLPFLDAAYNDRDFAESGTNFGVAGGLDAVAVDTHMRRITAHFPDVSWDAEGRMHESDDGSLAMDVVRDYLDASARTIS